MQMLGEMMVGSVALLSGTPNCFGCNDDMGLRGFNNFGAEFIGLTPDGSNQGRAVGAGTALKVTIGALLAYAVYRWLRKR